MVHHSSSSPDLQAYHLMRSGHFADALPLAEQAIVGRQACVPAHGMLAMILLQLGRALEAEMVISRALEYGNGTADAYDGLAHVSMLLGRHDRSNALYRRVVELAPKEPRFWYNLASSERSFGRLLLAEAACDRAIALDPTQYASYLLRSELRVQSPDVNHVEELRRQLARLAIDDRAQVPLAYALAKELDDLRQYDEAFRWFFHAAATRRRHLAYDVAVDERKMRRIIESFPTESLKSSSVADSGRFIFIVGLPRSGTTLLEHILTGLPDVRSNGETDYFARALIAASPAGPDDEFARAADAIPEDVASRYRALANPMASGAAIIEKLPMNYLYLGAIHRALPNSKLLLIKRSPIDSCFAMYRTLFGAAYPFSYDFEDLARYYAAYDRLVAHWRACLGGALHEVTYEELVKNPSHVGAAIAGYCGLQWQAQAIEVDKSATVSLTASAAQIRRPIYGSSSGRWRHYRDQLEPLKQALIHRGVPNPEGQ
jgi:tetratricopeptide (TPR) repeat protein